MGYCFGGTAVLELARSGENLKGFVAFHGGLETPKGQDYGKTRGEVLVFHGTADTLTSPVWSKRLYEQAPADDKTLKLYNGLYHETYHEPEKVQVLSDLAEWLKHRVD